MKFKFFCLQVCNIFAMISLFLSVTKSEDDFDVRPTSTTASEGDQITFNCVVKDKPVEMDGRNVSSFKHVDWFYYKNFTSQPERVGLSTSVNSKEAIYSLTEPRLPGHYNLTVRSVKPSDRGFYV